MPIGFYLLRKLILIGIIILVYVLHSIKLIYGDALLRLVLTSLLMNLRGLLRKNSVAETTAGAGAGQFVSTCGSVLMLDVGQHLNLVEDYYAPGVYRTIFTAIYCKHVKIMDLRCPLVVIWFLYV